MCGRKFLALPIALLAMVFAVGLSPAGAATTVYVDSAHPAYPGFADAVNSDESLGTPDGVGAFVPLGGFIAYLVDPTFTDVNFDIEFFGVTGAGTLRLYVGQTNGGTGFTALNSAFFTITNGVNNISSVALTNYCISIGGCDTFVLQAWVGTTFSVDSIAASSPEPATWALMIVSFFLVAARLKARRRWQNERGARRAGAFA